MHLMHIQTGTSQNSSREEIKYKVPPGFSGMEMTSMTGQSKLPPNKLDEREEWKKKLLQKNSSSHSGKAHFEVQLNKTAFAKQEEYTLALHQFTRIESFRKTKERVRIPLGNEDGYVILYAAEELSQLFGRPYRPANLKADEGYRPVRFVLTQEGKIKEVLLNDK